MENEYWRHTLCWGCARSCGLCPWSKGFQPVEGWKAEETKINNMAQEGKTRTTKSYRVIECPLFVAG